MDYTDELKEVVLDLPETRIANIEIKHSYITKTDKLSLFEQPILKFSNFIIKKSYIQKSPKRYEINFPRSKTSNDCSKLLPKTANEENYDRSYSKISFHTFKILREIGNGAYGKVFLV